MSKHDEKNAQTSREEVAAFNAETPDRYFAYGFTEPSGFDPIRRLHVGDKIGTWMGDPLGHVSWAGDPFHDNFGGIRQNFRMYASNGATYSGTAYLSAGDYVRMRKVNS